MSRTIALDSGPLGLITHPQQNPEVIAITRWLLACIDAGDRILVPAIVHYELRRELLRAKKPKGLARLDSFVESDPDCYLPLSDAALRFAADLWASARQQGRPTSSATDLDVDVILAAQVLLSAPSPANLIVATTNEKHLSLFVNAKPWGDIPVVP